MPTVDTMLSEITQKFRHWTIEAGQSGYMMHTLSTHDPVEYTTIHAITLTELIRHVWMYYYGKQ